MRKQMIERADGRSTFPQIFIGATHVGGCDDLYALDEAGGLDPLLAAAKDREATDMTMSATSLGLQGRPGPDAFGPRPAGQSRRCLAADRRGQSAPAPITSRRRK